MANQNFKPVSSFQMKPQPPSEYWLMKSLIEKFGFDGPHELFSMMLRLTYKITQMKEPIVGNIWIRNEIQEWRNITNKSERREYPL